MNFASPLTAPAELSARQVLMLFPTPMFTGKLIDLSLCDRLEKVRAANARLRHRQIVTQGHEPVPI